MSNIRDEFFKIAKEQGIVDSRETRMRKNDEYSKEFIDNIRALYNIDPRETDKSITQEAHPETCVISPAYDKTWGVIENGEQQQALMADIVFKPTNPTTNIRRIAESELIQELIKAATILDNEDKVEADIADELSEKLASDLERGLK